MAADATFLILGGCGFIGRNLAEYLVENNIGSTIVIADKAPPQTSWLNERHSAIFANPKVVFKQANLVNPAHVDRVFQTDGGQFDYVINLAAETRYGQSDEVYKDYVHTLSLNCAKKAAECGVKLFVELSTAQVYSSDKKASDETSKTSPWTSIAKYKLSVEEELAKVQGLKFIIIRPAVVYGIGDKLGLTPRLIIAAVYKHLGEKMKLLWTKDLRMNTVHVLDVCRAIWFLCEKGEPGHVYNLADKEDSTQGTISDHICKIFGIDYEFFGSVISNMARLNMSSVVEDSNDKHLAPWSEACQKDHIVNTPLSPYLDQELLYNTHLHVDGTKIEKLGFTYEKPNLNTDDLKEVVNDYVKLGVFPPSLAH